MRADEGISALPFSIRKATPDDIDSIARIWHSGWNDGHLGHVPRELLPYRREVDFVSRVPDRLATMWVAAESHGAVVGFVVVRQDEIEQLFVDRRARGTGVAAALLHHGEAEIRRSGHQRAWLAVVAGNHRARAFYVREGWRDSGPFTYMAETEAGPFAVPSHRYEIDLSEREPPVTSE
jgi:GNAT superfamily N-acetyltransferase